MNKYKDFIDNPLIYFGLANDEDFKDDAKLYKEQRMSRGFDDTELWNLHSSIAKYILPRLKEFKKETLSFPPGLKEEQWDEYLDKMIEAFEYYSDIDKYDNEASIKAFNVNAKDWMKLSEKELTSKMGEYKKLMEENYSKAKEGLKLFADYFMFLNW